MEGPTPVSAFLHAASMITCGVYLFYLFFFNFNYFFLILLSFFSVVFFSIIALISFDLKKLIASSTGSQMGYILFFFTLDFFYFGLFLLCAHSLFKSFLFFLVGFLVVFNSSFQDIRLVFVSFIFFLLLFILFSSLCGF